MNPDDYDECERCGNLVLPGDLSSVELCDSWELCGACIESLDDSTKYYDWRHRYTEDHHQRAADWLSSQDEIECVLKNYDEGKIIVHTPYVSSDVVFDVCRHFGLQIASFGPRWEEEQSWECVDDHGSIFEVLLQYGHHCKHPAHVNAKMVESSIENLDESDKQF